MVKFATTRFFAFLCCLAFLLSPCDRAWSLPDRTNSIATNERGGLSFALYNRCAVVTVRDARERVESHEPHQKTLILTAHIDEMLCGDLSGHDNVIFAIDRSSENIFSDKSCSELCGKKIVLAFRFDSLDTRMQREAIVSDLPVLDISNVTQFFSGKQFSNNDLRPLRRHRPTKIFPYTTCLELRLDNACEAPIGAVNTPTASVDATILKVLLDDRSALCDPSVFSNGPVKPVTKFRTGEQFKFAISSEQWDKLFPGKPVSKLVGTKCLLSFDYGLTKTRDYQALDRLAAPFPDQMYTNTEVSKLSAELSESATYLFQLKSDLESYIAKRWTEKRIARFCQTGTCQLRGMQSGTTMFEEGKLYGRLYPQSESKLGKVSWYCGLRDGVPNEYQVQVQRGERYFWVLEDSGPRPGSFSEDDLTKSIILRKLSNAWWAYYFAQKDNDKLIPPGVTDLMPRFVGQLVRNGKSKISALEVKLGKAHILTVNLSEKDEIKSLFVDGQPNLCWSEILAQEPANLEKFFEEHY